ncbi:MAG TPA: hypothetical protein VGK74_12530 [Symbiobacteriaceae bacterium]
MGELPTKENPAQRATRVKREKSFLDLLPDIDRYAREGFTSIEKDDLEIRFRSWGLYTQGDGQGVRGSNVPLFLLRIRIPGGQLWSHQVRTIADISERYAQSTLDITDRQNAQLHYIRIEDVPTIFGKLWQAGMTSQAACGDLVRNVTTCPLAGLQHGELIDPLPFVRDVDRLMLGNPVFADLPRKFKLTITGCPSWCSLPEINDIGLTAIARRRGQGNQGWQDEVGFSLRVGGGLASRPHLARRLNVFIQTHQVLDVVQAATALFRDSDILRENRSKARLKFLFLDHGWDEERFVAELERRLGYKLAPAAPEEPPRETHRDHLGIHSQKQPGLSYAGFAVPGGRLTPGQYRDLANLADAYGDGNLRQTVQQNIIITGLQTDRLPAFETAAAATGLSLAPSTFLRGTVACTGIQYCKFALTETKAFSTTLIADLERRLPDFAHGIKIHINGCPNSCGQHWIADIGLQGVRVKAGEETVDGYEFFLGGGVAGQADIARRVPYRTAAADVPAAVERLLLGFMGGRDEGELFQDFCRRQTPDELKALLAGVAPGAGVTEAAD